MKEALDYIRKKLESFPRIPFSLTPTPCHRLSYISDAYGVDVFCKRDDLCIPGGPRSFLPEAYDMMALGYPAIEPSGKLMGDRAKIHHDDCGRDDFRSDHEVEDFIKRARNWTIGTRRRT